MTALRGSGRAVAACLVGAVRRRPVGVYLGVQKGLERYSVAQLLLVEVAEVFYLVDGTYRRHRVTARRGRGDGVVDGRGVGRDGETTWRQTKLIRGIAKGEERTSHLDGGARGGAQRTHAELRVEEESRRPCATRQEVGRRSAPHRHGPPHVRLSLVGGDNASAGRCSRQNNVRGCAVGCFCREDPLSSRRRRHRRNRQRWTNLQPRHPFHAAFVDLSELVCEDI
mmetsp:Transcript_47458/g.111699  ORF Transcript_47458/g.111699 Transcript_47458/m.111699 type:complete len:225 (+) Transcript_47458:399-1073(+)